MVQLPDELSHKTKQNLITHNITRGHLLRNNKKYPPPPPPPPPPSPPPHSGICQIYSGQIKTKPSYRISFTAYFHISERCRLTSSDLTSPSSSTVSRNSFLNCAFCYVLTDLSATVMYKITEDMCSPDFVPIG